MLLEERSPSCRASVRAWAATSHSPWLVRRRHRHGQRRDKGLIKVSGRSRARPPGCLGADRHHEPRGLARLARTAREELGRVDILVNNAFSDGTYSMFADSDLAGWRDHRRQPHRHAPAHPGRAAVPQGAGRQPHHHDQQPERAGHGRDVRGVLRVEGGAQRRHQDPGPRARERRRAGQRHPPQLHLGSRSSGTSTTSPRSGASTSRWSTTSSPTRTASSTCRRRRRSPAPSSSSPHPCPRPSPGRASR